AGRLQPFQVHARVQKLDLVGGAKLAGEDPAAHLIANGEDLPVELPGSAVNDSKSGGAGTQDPFFPKPPRISGEVVLLVMPIECRAKGREAKTGGRNLCIAETSQISQAVTT